ncbi:MAG: hypothetical protein IT428_02545 [Planctomycetaceae bacterium]|nr:hypothetical protein [Planctomycetaceae bacterium]
MVALGQIKGLFDSVGIDVAKWLALIDEHALLKHVPPRKGINPFTREACELKAPASTAIVHSGGTEIGSISLATDGSELLIVQSHEGSAEVVTRIAEELARLLGGQFVRDSA